MAQICGVTSGTARLSSVELKTSMKLRRAMAEKSLPIRVGLWTGGCSSESWRTDCAGCPMSRSRRGVDLAIHATTLELHATSPVPPVDDDALAKAWGALMHRLPPEKGAAFERATTAGTAARSDDACQAFKALATHVKELAPLERDTLIRSVTCPFLIPSGP